MYLNDKSFKHHHSDFIKCFVIQYYGIEPSDENNPTKGMEMEMKRMGKIEKDFRFW